MQPLNSEEPPKKIPSLLEAFYYELKNVSIVLLLAAVTFVLVQLKGNSNSVVKNDQKSNQLLAKYP